MGQTDPAKLFPPLFRGGTERGFLTRSGVLPCLVHVRATLAPTPLQVHNVRVEGRHRMDASNRVQKSVQHHFLHHFPPLDFILGTG